MIGQSKVPAADLDWFAMSGALGVASTVVLTLVLFNLLLAISIADKASSGMPT
jgi:hypothetical protein